VPQAALLEEIAALRQQVTVLESDLQRWQQRARRYQTSNRALRQRVTQCQPLSEVQRTMLAAIEQHPHMLLLTNQHGIVEYVNPQFTRLTGYSPTDIVGKPLHIPPLDNVPPAAQEAFWQRLGSGMPWRGEWNITTKQGHTYCAAVSMVPIRQADDMIRHFLVVKTDITDTVRLQQRLAQDERLASLGTLATGLAHELNQPLTAIWVAVDTILYGLEHGWSVSEDRLSDRLRLVAEQCQRAAKVVEDVRLFARDSEQHHCTPGILQDGLQRVLRLLGTQLSRHGITLRQQIPPDFPPVLLSQMHLERVLSNLLTNARQALDTIDKPGKTITLTAHVDTPVAVLCVEDNGPGIPPASRSQLFDPFFTTKAPGEGTGLGLSIVHGLITDAGGDITVTEGQEGGAAFVVRMPIMEEG
jgi:PAS domain S-box-containing protein